MKTYFCVDTAFLQKNKFYISIYLSTYMCQLIMQLMVWVTFCVLTVGNNPSWLYIYGCSVSPELTQTQVSTIV